MNRELPSPSKVMIMETSGNVWPRYFGNKQSNEGKVRIAKNSPFLDVIDQVGILDGGDDVD